jgi:DNA-binding MurR/RpiR family transcriptional regulator
LTPQDFDQEGSPVHQKILALFEQLSPKQHRLARYFLDHEHVIAFASANTVGKENDVSAATVVRFARALGYEGYTDLQDDIRAALPQYPTPSQKLAQRLSEGGFVNNISADIAEVNIRNIEQTLQNVSLETLDRAVEAIVDADRILIFSGGLSSTAAVMAQHSLTMLGFQARAIINGGLTQTLEMSTINPGDTVIVISIWRYLKDTVAVANYAHGTGAKVIALTDSLVSPLAPSSDCVFIAATERAAHSRSLTGLISLIDLINATIVSKRPRESMQALQRIDDLYHQQGSLVED